MGLISWWYDLPVPLRLGFALLLIGISTAPYFFANLIWPWGWAVGGILLLFCGAGSNKGGYNF